MGNRAKKLARKVIRQEAIDEQKSLQRSRQETARIASKDSTDKVNEPTRSWVDEVAEAVFRNLGKKE